MKLLSPSTTLNLESLHIFLTGPLEYSILLEATCWKCSWRGVLCTYVAPLNLCYLSYLRVLSRKPKPHAILGQEFPKLNYNPVRPSRMLTVADFTLDATSGSKLQVGRIALNCFDEMWLNMLTQARSACPIALSIKIMGYGPYFYREKTKEHTVYRSRFRMERSQKH